MLSRDEAIKQVELEADKFKDYILSREAAGDDCYESVTSFANDISDSARQLQHSYGMVNILTEIQHIAAICLNALEKFGKPN
jgi:hypothetical protein